MHILVIAVSTSSSSVSSLFCLLSCFPEQIKGYFNFFWKQTNMDGTWMERCSLMQD